MYFNEVDEVSYDITEKCYLSATTHMDLWITIMGNSQQF